MSTLEEKIKHVVTWLWVRVILRAEWVGAKDLQLSDQSIRVYVFKKGGWVPAQTTVFNTIVWNNEIMGTQPEEVRRLALYHERSHQDRNKIYQGTLWGFVILAATGIAYSLLSLSYSVMFGVPLSNFGSVFAQSGMLVGLFLILFRIEETKADYDALCKMDEKRFREAYRQFTPDRQPSILSRLFGSLLYTDPEYIIKIRKTIQSLF